MLVGDKHLMFNYFHRTLSVGFTVNVLECRNQQVSGVSLGISNWLVDSNGQKKIARLFQADLKTTKTHIITCYNRGVWKSIYEHTTYLNLKQVSYSSRISHNLPLEPA